jgi:proteasome lid subunit RPN8/RPN11
MQDATVTVYPIRSDAEIARARLAADGIRSLVVADDEGGLNPGFYARYGVRVVVDAVDLDDAMASLGIERLAIPRGIAAALVDHAVTSLPYEACGLILFDDDTPVFACQLSNVARSAHRFTIDPSEHHGAWEFGRRRGWTIGAIYHSHPRTEAHPSRADVAGRGDPKWIHVIVGHVDRPSPSLRAFRLADGVVTEVSVTIGA